MSWDGWVSGQHSTAQCSAAQGRQKMQPPLRRGGLPHVGFRQLTPHARRGMGRQPAMVAQACSNSGMLTTPPHLRGGGPPERRCLPRASPAAQNQF